MKKNKGLNNYKRDNQDLGCIMGYAVTG